MIRADGQIKALALRKIYKDKVPEAANEGQTFTILITGSGFEGHWLKEDVGITIQLKMEMLFAYVLTAAFVTGMENKLCAVSHLRWGGNGPEPQSQEPLLCQWAWGHFVWNWWGLEILGTHCWVLVKKPFLKSSVGWAAPEQLQQRKWGEKGRMESGQRLQIQLPPREVCSDFTPWLGWCCHSEQ